VADAPPPRTGLIALAAAALALVVLPAVLAALGLGYYLGFATRVLIYAVAAQSLNLLAGYAGLASFGHAAFVGAGAYTVAILARNGVDSAVVAWPAAIVVAALLSALIGILSLRTRGVYFIMITLAFAQMLFYLAVSLKAYGGEDGLALARRSSLPGLDPRGDVAFYYVVLVLTALAFLLLGRVTRSRFGRAIEAIRDNETRAAAIGFAVFRYRLAAFVIGGAFAGLAGALLVNLNAFVTPSNLSWEASGILLVMAILGGLGTPLGGLFGALAVLGLEEVLRGLTVHWPIGFAAVVLAVVLLSRRGIAGLFVRGGAG
jgi:branched-chain amino acid transport system permease protein